MAQLTYPVYGASSKLAASDNLPPGLSEAPEAPQAFELRHLRYFVALADAGSFTHAAKRMFMAGLRLAWDCRLSGSSARRRDDRPCGRPSDCRWCFRRPAPHWRNTAGLCTQRGRQRPRRRNVEASVQYARHTPAQVVLAIKMRLIESGIKESFRCAVG